MSCAQRSKHQITSGKSIIIKALTITSMDNTTRIQMAKAVEITARKVPFKPKEESVSESFRRITLEKEARKNCQVKRAAKKMVKKKQIKKMTAYFGSK